MSNLWESVQRGLEKASHEAARIARAQRLRSTIDSLSRQIHTDNTTLLTKTMDLFIAGQMTQAELLPLCQELANLKQQLEQAQSELKALQSQSIQQPSNTPTYTTPPTVPYAGSNDANPTIYTPSTPPIPSTQPAPPPPPGYSSFDTAINTLPIPTPPPPPGVEQPTLSALETLIMDADTPPAQKQQCPLCHAERVPGVAYCHNCGTRLEGSGVAHLPTVRGGMVESSAGQETAQTSTTTATGPQETLSDDEKLPPEEPLSQSKDGGD